jgi:hypothetical protein
MSVEIVLTAVDFNNETMLETDEVNDKAVARCLTTEMVSSFTP